MVGISCILNIKKCKKIADINGNCAQCYTGYTLTNNYCVQCLFTGCIAANSSIVNNVCTCTSCSLGYYLPSGSIMCSPCSTLNCVICPTNICTNCLTGFYWNGASCAVSTVANCFIAATATTCNTCMSRYFKGSSNLCYSCQSSCKTCSTRFRCSECDANYYLHPIDLFCVKLPNNCLNFSTTTNMCSTCQHGYYLNSGYCQECSIEVGTVNYLFI